MDSVNDTKVISSLKPLQVLKRILALNWEYILPQAGIVLLIVISSFLELFETDALKHMIDAVSAANLEVLKNYFFITLGIVVSNGILYFLAGYLGTNIDILSILNIQTLLVKKLFRVKMLVLKEYHSGDILSRVQDSVSQAQTGIVNQTRQTSKDVFMLFLSLSYLVIINWKLMFSSVLFISVIPFIMNFLSAKLRKIYYNEQSQTAAKNIFINDAVQNLEVIKAYSLEDKFKGIFRGKYSEIQRWRRKAYLWEGIMENLQNCLLVIGDFFIIGYGAFLVSKNELSIGGIFSFLILFERIVDPISSIIQIWSRLQKSIANALRFLELLDLPEESSLEKSMSAGCTLETRKTDCTMGLFLKDISYCYPQGKNILEDVSLHILPGEKTLIYGKSGDGKSTLINLILRFYEPENGDIFWNGSSIYTTKLQEWRNKIAYVSQDSILFTGSILENIRYGNLDSSDDNIYNISRRLGIHDFIIKKEQGYITQLGLGGAQLSGGELQRLTIARALLRVSDIFILDEPSSHLDVENEKLFFDFLDDLLENKVVIIISHKQAHFNKVNKVFCLCNGKLMEQKI